MVDIPISDEEKEKKEMRYNCKAALVSNVPRCSIEYLYSSEATFHGFLKYVLLIAPEF